MIPPGSLFRYLRGMGIEPGAVVVGLQGSYRVEARHGEGSFGVTYRATDASTGAAVILKELRIERLDDWKALELFEREGRVLASLSHPNIPAFRDFFAHGAASPLPVGATSTYDGPERLSLVLVQQLIEGATLQQRLESGRRLSPDEAERVLRDLLRALEYLHDRSPPLIHRDIKPGNVILTPEGQPYLVDFGAIQERLRSAGSVGSTIVGTLGYMPLEQTRGQARPASDLYALGVTMIVALAGRPLDELPVDESTGQIALDRAVPSGTPAPLREALDAMIVLLVAQRAQSAADVLRLLGAHREPSPEPARKEGAARKERSVPKARSARKEQSVRKPPPSPRPAPVASAEPSSPPGSSGAVDTIPMQSGPPPRALFAFLIGVVGLAGGAASFHAMKAPRGSLSASAASARTATGGTQRAILGPWLADDCRPANTSGCSTLASHYSAASPPDLFRSADAYRMACEGGEARGCNGIGWRYLTGRGIDKDIAAGVAAFGRSCDAGHQPGCDSLAFALLNGQGSPPDEARALGLFQRACDAKVYESCVLAGVMQHFGRATARSESKAVALFQRGCPRAGPKAMETTCARYDLEPEECAIGGLELSLGACGPVDRARAEPLLTKACRDGWTWACDRLK